MWRAVARSCCARGGAAAAAAAVDKQTRGRLPRRSIEYLSCGHESRLATRNSARVTMTIHSPARLFGRRPGASTRAGCWGRLQCESLGMRRAERAERAARCEIPAALPSWRFRMEPRSAAPAACGRARVTSVVFTAAVEQVVRRARGVRFRSRGGCRSRRRFSSLDPAPSTSAHVYCDAPSIKTDVRQRRAGGAGSWAAVGRGGSAASATSRARAGLLQSRRCSRVAVAAANDKGECARWWCVCVAPPATGHWPAPLPWLAYKEGSAAARLRPPPFPQCHAPRHCCITRESLHQRCITCLHQTCIACIKPASPASSLHHLHQTCITCITRASTASRVHQLNHACITPCAPGDVPPIFLL